MAVEPTATTADELVGLAPDAVPDEYERRNLRRLSDERLFELLAAVISRPKEEAADSFVLHAPLELLARRALLGWVEPGRREQARQRLVWGAPTSARAGAPLARDGRRDDLFASAGDAVARLTAALAAGDLDAVDDAARWLGGRATVADLAPLADGVVTSLAAAAHASIYLYQLPRVAPRSRAAVGLLRPLARELGRRPDWRLCWPDERPPARGHRTEALTEALLSTPRLGRPGSDFIYPLLHQAEESGLARELVGPVLGGDVDPASASRALLRVAAWSMLQDDPGAAPYGWTHCLTLPQATAALASAADAGRAVAVAATHVVGFRAALSTAPVEAGFDPAPVAVTPLDALDADPGTAAAAAYHAPDVDAVVTALATRAALHPDAHLAKYTLACADAAAADPHQRRLYLAAAAYLSAWWAQVPVDDPLAS